MRHERWVVLLLCVVACLLSGTPAPAAAAPPGDRGPAPASRGPVVVVGIPDLRWQDVSPSTTPALWELARTASVAALTDRSGEGGAHRATGWLVLNTGSRARSNVEPETVPDPTFAPDLEALKEANAGARYHAPVGALGDALRTAGVPVVVVGGDGAALGAMARDGRSDGSYPSVGDALARAGVVVVELPQLYETGRSDAAAVRAALAQVDQQVAEALAVLPADGTLLVAGVSDAASGPAHLHVAMATGPSFGPGLLTSPTTGRTGVVQLIDVAPTVLSLTGADVPSAVLGAPWRTVRGERPVAEQLASFVELDQRSLTTQAAVPWYYPAVTAVALLYAMAVLVGWWLRRTRLLRPLGAVVAAVPIAGYLAQLVPWWRAGTWPLAPLTVGGAALLGLAAMAVPWTRRSPWALPALVGGATALVLVADAATGSPLSLDAPFADNPIVAGRFHGLGNVAFALLGAGTLLTAAAVVARRSGRAAVLPVAGLGVLAVAVDGLPWLGDDFGGVLALVPAVAVLALVVARRRIAVGHLAAVAAAGVLAAAAFALYDYTRPASQRSHLGRFVGQLADGSALAAVHRKFDTSVSTFTGGWARWMVLAWIVVALVAWMLLRRGRLSPVAAVDARTAGGLVAALGVLMFLGAALNDSGAEIPAFAGYLALPLLVPLLRPAGAPPSDAPEQPETTGATASVPR